MDQLHTIGSYGFSNAVLPLEGETLTLRIEDQVDVEAQYPAISVGSCAFSGVKNKEGTAFSKASVTIGGTVQFGDYSFNASDVFGSSAALEELTFHLKEGAYLSLEEVPWESPLCAALCLPGRDRLFSASQLSLCAGSTLSQREASGNPGFQWVYRGDHIC